MLQAGHVADLFRQKRQRGVRLRAGSGRIAVGLVDWQSRDGFSEGEEVGESRELKRNVQNRNTYPRRRPRDRLAMTVEGLGSDMVTMCSFIPQVRRVAARRRGTSVDILRGFVVLRVLIQSQLAIPGATSPVA